jgi:RNA polymerase sigma-70 factor (TIGR02943 family)
MEKTTHTLSDPKTWLEQYGQALYLFACTRVDKKETAEDLVQETLLAGLTARSRFQGKSTEKTWLIAILKNKIFQVYRKGKREWTESELCKDSDNLGFMDKLFDEDNHWLTNPKDFGPDEKIENQELGGIINQCIDKLSRPFRRLFVMREIDGVSAEEICEELGLSSSNLWVSMHRARTQLRMCMEKNYLKDGGARGL